MKLIDILVQETLSGKFKWPEYCYALVQGSGGAVYLAGGGMHLQNFELAEDWELAEVTREQYEAALAAAQPQWDGQGLPPVGCVCEYAKKSIPCNEWTECTVDYVGSAFIVYRDCYGVELTGIKGDIIFRPIRSEADKKREKGVIALSRVDPRVAPFEYGDKFPDGSLVGAPWYELYDAIAAGKIPGLRIE